eukprot:4617656-Amphidinium_carterae.1
MGCHLLVSASGVYLKGTAAAVTNNYKQQLQAPFLGCSSASLPQTGPQSPLTVNFAVAVTLVAFMPDDLASPSVLLRLSDPVSGSQSPG